MGPPQRSAMTPKSLSLQYNHKTKIKRSSPSRMNPELRAHVKHEKQGQADGHRVARSSGVDLFESPARPLSPRTCGRTRGRQADDLSSPLAVSRGKAGHRDADRAKTKRPSLLESSSVSCLRRSQISLSSAVFLHPPSTSLK